MAAKPQHLLGFFHTPKPLPPSLPPTASSGMPLSSPRCGGVPYRTSGPEPDERQPDRRIGVGFLKPWFSSFSGPRRPTNGGESPRISGWRPYRTPACPATPGRSWDPWAPAPSPAQPGRPPGRHEAPDNDRRATRWSRLEPIRRGTDPRRFRIGTHAGSGAAIPAPKPADRNRTISSRTGKGSFAPAASRPSPQRRCRGRCSLCGCRRSAA